VRQGTRPSPDPGCHRSPRHYPTSRPSSGSWERGAGQMHAGLITGQSAVLCEPVDEESVALLSSRACRIGLRVGWNGGRVGVYRYLVATKSRVRRIRRLASFCRYWLSLLRVVNHHYLPRERGPTAPIRGTRPANRSSSPVRAPVPGSRRPDPCRPGARRRPGGGATRRPPTTRTPPRPPLRAPPRWVAWPAPAGR
jgi:hypothetical protein